MATKAPSGSVLRKEEEKVIKKMEKLADSLSQSGFREYVDYLGSPWRMFWLNLFAGAARGFGFVLGATVVVTIAVWLISQYLVNLPYVGELFEIIQESIESGGLVKLRTSIIEYMQDVK